MRWGLVLFGLLACQLPQSLTAGAASSDFGLPTDISAPRGGGYEIPMYGEQEKITRVYRALDGHLILAFVYKSPEGLKSGLYDTVSGKRAYPELERKAASDNSIEGNFVRTHRFKQISSSVGPTPKGKEVHNGYGGGRICPNNPYTIDFSVGPNWDDRFQLFEKLPHPTRKDLGPDCGVTNATYRYRDRVVLFYANDNGFFAQLDRFFIWFDWNAHSDFLKGRDDFVVVPATVLEPALVEKHEDGMAYDPDAIRNADRIIAQYGARQRKEKKHV